MNYLISKFKTNKPLFILFGLQIIFVIFSFIYFISENQLRNSLMSLLTLLLIPAYLGVEKILKIKFGYGFLCLVIFLTLGGIVLGPCYDLYMHIPIFDDILQLSSGFIFCCLGFTISIQVIKDSRFYIHVLVGVLFSLSVAVVWEMIEYFGTTFAGIDMQEDTIVKSFRSFYLANSHNDIVVIENIKHTIIVYGENEKMLIDGYLDLGLYDTLNDLLICISGAIIYMFIMFFDKKGYSRKLFCVAK